MPGSAGAPAPLFDPARHEPLDDRPWREGVVRDEVAAICRDAEAAFDPDLLWPLHPADAEPGTSPIVRGVYLGATGMLHGLGRLAEAGLYEPALDAAAIVAGLPASALETPDEEGTGGSFLAGSSGALLVAYGLAPSADRADAVAGVIAAHVDHPANELLVGSPGTMLVARAMHAWTGEERFADLWRTSARTLLERQEDDGLWTQDLYGTRARYIGAAHGFAGVVHTLLAAPEWLDDATGFVNRALETTRRLAVIDGDRASWTPLDTGGSLRVQWCHGSAGIVTSLGAAAPDDDEHGALMTAAGELVWQAGPPAQSAGLCHGTGGNGFAFLTLFARTGEERWLERARAFAMHALEQAARFRAADGRGRYSLYTGDVGAALLAAACLDGDARFPGIDDWVSAPAA